MKKDLNLMFHRIIKSPEEALPAPDKAVGLERFKNTMYGDRMSAAGRLCSVIKSDFYSMILNYMEVNPADIRLDISCHPDGGYVLRIEAPAQRIYTLNTLEK